MDKPKFVYVTLIKTTPEKLWEALTDPKFTRQYWFNTSVESDWKVGFAHEIVMRWKDGRGSPTRASVLKSEPPRLLSYTFHPLSDEQMRKEGASRVTFEIEPLGDKPGPKGDAVRLTVTHEDFPAGSVLFPKISNGWPAILSDLKTLLETGQPMGLTK